MKKLAIAIAIVLLLSAGAMAGTIAPASTGIINGLPDATVAAAAVNAASLTNTSGWTLVNMAENSGLISLNGTNPGLWDDFGDGSINSAIWNTRTGGNGKFAESKGYLLYNGGTLNSDAGIFYYKTLVSNTLDSMYITNAIAVDVTTGHEATMLGLNARPVSPALTTGGIFRAIEIDFSSSSGMRIIYVDAASNGRYWNGTGWSAANVSLGAVKEGDLYQLSIIVNAAGWTARIKNDTLNIISGLTDTVPWSNTTGTGSNYWLLGGDQFTGSAYPRVVWLKMFTDYQKWGTATMGAISVNKEITALYIEEIASSGCSTSWAYDTGSGFTTPGGGTLAELRTAIVGTTPATLNLKATVTGSGYCPGTFRITNNTITN